VRIARVAVVSISGLADVATQIFIERALHSQTKTPDSGELRRY